MVNTVTINTITGSEDFNVWISNGCLDTDVSIFIDTISNADIPYTFNVPATYQNSAFCVKIYDDNDCKICECFGFGPSPTPSPTPSITPSITVTPTLTPTPSPSGPCLVPTYFHGSFTGNGFTETVTYTLSVDLYNNRAQWVSDNNGTIRWNGYRWEISNWNLAGVTYYNGNVSTLYAPDVVNWVYQGCAKGFICNVEMTSEGCGPAPSPSPSPTPTVTPTISTSTTPSTTPNATPSNTPSISVTATPSNTPNSSPSSTPSVTPSISVTATPSNTPNSSPSNTPSVTPTISVSTTPSVTPASSPSNTPSVTSSVTPTVSTTPSISLTPTPSITPGSSPSNTPSNTPSVSVTSTPSVSVTTTPSNTPSVSVTNTPSNTPSVSVTTTPSGTPRPSVTSTPSNTPSVSVTSTPSTTPRPSITSTPSTTPRPSITSTPSNTPSVSVTSTPSSTPIPRESVTPTPTSTPPIEYQRFVLAPCCDNTDPEATILPTAYLPSTYSPGDVVSLDGVCYTIGALILGTAVIPSSIVQYDTETQCLADDANYKCVYTLQACAETVAGLGNVMVQPTSFNILLGQILTAPQYYQVGSLITNISSGQFTIDDCYSLVDYNPSLSITTPYSINGAIDCLQAGKCDYVNVLVTNCVDDKTSIVQFDYDNLTGNTLSSGDTISAPTLAIYTSNQTTGTCYTIGGKTTTITSPQTQMTGTWWDDPGTQYSIQSNCEDSDCGCKSNFIVTSTSSSPILLQYKLCSGELTDSTIPAFGSVEIGSSRCVNMNSLWAYAISNGYFNQITISGTYSNC